MKKVLKFIFIFLCIHLICGSMWVNYYFGDVCGDVLLFHLIVPLDGVNNDTFISYFLLGILPTIIFSILVLFLLKKVNKKKLFYSLFFLFSFIFAIVRLDLHTYISDQINSSDFIENNYVDVKDIKLEFPEEKRNLIYIFLESMENTYTSYDNGGGNKHNLIPNLVNVRKENISFSNTKKSGGALSLDGSSWTVAAMFSQTSGLPLKLNLSSNGLISLDEFMPGVVSIGEVLEKNGYQNYILMGSDSDYGLRSNYFKQHGNYLIYDVNWAINNGLMKEEDKVWWGFDDNTLFDIAKDQLLEIALEDEPFNYTILTVDTHFEDGYLSFDCENKYDDKYSNVILCNDRKVYKFLDWLEKQEFYDETTIVLVGDHLSMDRNYFNDVDDDYIRTTYNAFINSSVTTKNINNRLFSSLDMFPTTLASLGVDIEGDRIALGTNLFSSRETIIEEYGYDKVFLELNKRSSFYNNKFVSYE